MISSSFHQCLKIPSGLPMYRSVGRMPYSSHRRLTARAAFERGRLVGGNLSGMPLPTPSAPQMSRGAQW